MEGDRGVLEHALERLLHGKDIHVEVASALDGLDWKLAGVRPEGAPHSILRLVNHMSFWQEWGLQWLDGEEPPIPKHASGSWPGDQEPASSAEWGEAVERLRKGLDELHRRCREADLLARRGKRSRLEVLQAIAAHNSYHLGQVVMLRQMLGSWPPPSGGLTW